MSQTDDAAPGKRSGRERTRASSRSRGRSAVRFLKSLPLPVVLTAALLAGFALSFVLRAAGQAEQTDALAAWAAACARLEEAYGSEAASRIEALRSQALGSGLNSQAEAPREARLPLPVTALPRPARPQSPAGAGIPAVPSAMPVRPSALSVPPAPAVLQFLNEAAASDPVIEKKPTAEQAAGTLRSETDLLPPDGLPAAAALPAFDRESAPDTAASLLNGKTVPDEDARAFFEDSPLLHAAGTPEKGADALVIFTSPTCPACQSLMNLVREKASELGFPVFIAPAGDAEAAAAMLAPDKSPEKKQAAAEAVRRNTAFAAAHLGRARFPAALWLTPGGARMAGLGGSSFAVLAGALNIRAEKRLRGDAAPPKPHPDAVGAEPGE